MHQFFKHTGEMESSDYCTNQFVYCSGQSVRLVGVTIGGHKRSQFGQVISPLSRKYLVDGFDELCSPVKTFAILLQWKAEVCQREPRHE